MRSKANILPFSAIAAAGFFFIATDARAYRVLEKNGLPVGWNSDEVTFELSPTTPLGLTFESGLAQIQAAAQAWNAQAACGAPRILISGTPAGAVSSGDDRNTIQWVFLNWSALGVTTEGTGYTDILVETLDNQSRIREADILLNAENFAWSTDVVQQSGVASVFATLLHEFGHALGLDHPCEFTPVTSVPDCTTASIDKAALMYPVLSDGTRQAVTVDETAGLCAIYARSDCGANGMNCGSGDAAQVAQCVIDNDCNTGEYCHSNTCVSVPGSLGDRCKSNVECESELCDKGACREVCTTDGKCLSGDVCNLETMVCGTATKAFGATCSAAEQCVTGLCYVDPGPKNYCTRACSSTLACPLGYECRTEGRDSFCARPAPSADGCVVARGGSSTSFGAFGLLGGLVLAALRRLLQARAVK